MPQLSSGDVSPDDEVKVYRLEGEGEEEARSSAENLIEEKTSLITEQEERSRKNAQQQHPGEGSSRNVPRLGPQQPFPHGQQRGSLAELHPLFLGNAWRNNGSPYPNYFGYQNLPMVNHHPLVPPSHSPSPYPIMVYDQPPPAHMGITPVRVNPKAGIPRPHAYSPLPSPIPYSNGPNFHPELHPQFWPPTSMYSHPLASSFPPSPFQTPLAADFQNKMSLYHASGIPGNMSIPMPRPGSRMDFTLERILCSYSPTRPMPGFPHQNGHHHPPSPCHSPPLVPISSKKPDPEKTLRAVEERKVPHIKKPLNAFMLFMKERRPMVIAESCVKESAAINQRLGQEWHSLSKEQQAKFYEKAKVEREKHLQKYPGWTARDNYAINARKKKRKRDKSQEGDVNNPKKCRARFGLDQQSSWCKPCRRKKKCIRYIDGEDNSAGDTTDNIGSVSSLEVPTPDSRCSNTNDNESTSGDNTSGLGSPVPRPSGPVQSFHGSQRISPGCPPDAQISLIRAFTSAMDQMPINIPQMPTPPSTDSSPPTVPSVEVT